MKRASLLALPVLFTACFGPPSTVTRVIEGRRVDGRYVNDVAYAAYLRGAVLEARGDLGGALDAYREALVEDRDSPELWTRIGAVRCALADAQGGPWEAFDRASALDAEYEATWAERAACRLARGDVTRALESARTAVALAPNRIDDVTLLVRTLEASNQLDEARRWMDGLVTREPGSREAQRAMLDFARRTGDQARGEAAARALVVVAPHLRDESSSDAPPLAPLAAMDVAIAHDEPANARTLAVRARMASGHLALRAAAIGNLPFARSQGELVLDADPRDADARIALATVSDLTHDDAALARALTGVPTEPTAPSPLGGLLLGELIERRVGSEAARAWYAAMGRVEAGGDPLVVEALERRKR